MEFPEALKLLAEKAGVEIRREDPQIRSKRNRLLEVLSEASNFYQKSLAEDNKPYQYLLERGLKPETIHEFKLGFAPEGWRNLYDHLSSKGFTVEEIESAGLLVRQPNSYYDRFRSRIMFPITDPNGRVIGFTGRIFGAEQEGGKYVNTPETLLFDKGRILYGLDRTREEIRKTESAVLVEGQMDFLMSWQDDVRNVVASSGTALTHEQIYTLKRLCKSIVLAFDMDSAGESATDRSISRAQEAGLEVRVATLPTGKDAAEFAKAFPGKLPEILEKALPAMEYFFEKTFGDGSAVTLEEKKSAISYLLPRIKTLRSQVEQSHWLEKLARKLRVDERNLHEELKRAPLPEEETGTRPIETILLPEKTRLEILAERALALALKIPEKAGVISEYILFFPPRHQEFAGQLSKTSFSVEKGLPATDFVSYLLLRSEYELAVLGEKDIAEELSLTLKELKREKLRTALRELGLAVQEAEFAKNEDRLKTLLQEFNQLSSQLINEEN